MIENLTYSVLIIAIGIAFLAIKVIIRKNGTMSSMHIHDSQAMKERGIHCVMDQDKEERARQRRVSEKINKKTRENKENKENNK